MATKNMTDVKAGWLKEISIYEEGTIDVVLNFETCTEQVGVSNDFTRYDIMVKCENIVEMPIDGNPRGVNIYSNSFKTVRKTITTKDMKLQNYHLGGDIFANHVKVDYDKKEIILTFCSTEMGLVNGSTSVAAILYSLYMGDLQSGNLISFRVRDYASDKLTTAQRIECVNNAAALNNVVAQKNEDLSYQKGHFDDIYSALSKINRKLFYGKPNYKLPKGVIKLKPNVLLRILECMDIKKYPNFETAPTVVNDAPNKIVNDFHKKCNEMEIETNGEYVKPYTYLLPLLNNFVEFYGFILYHWDDGIKQAIDSLEVGSDKRNHLETVLKTLSSKKSKKIVNAETKEITYESIINDKAYITAFTQVFEGDAKYQRVGKITAESFTWAIFTAFRSNIDYNEATNTIGFKVDPYILWNRCNVKLLKDIYTSLINDCKSATTEFVKKPGCWSRLYNIVDEEIEAMEAEEKRGI